MFRSLLTLACLLAVSAVKLPLTIKSFTESRNKRRLEPSALEPSAVASTSQNEETFNDVLKDTFLSNKLSAKDVARLARSGKSGGNDEAGVASMAKAGNWGKAPKNLARDLLRSALRGVDMRP